MGEERENQRKSDERRKRKLSPISNEEDEGQNRGHNSSNSVPKSGFSGYTIQGVTSVTLAKRQSKYGREPPKSKWVRLMEFGTCILKVNLEWLI